MTYCLGILLNDGLVLASDSRSNAGIDQVQEVSKLAVIEQPGERVIAIQSAGNLATTQWVVTKLRQAAGSGEVGKDVFTAPTMFEVVEMVAGRLREAILQDKALDDPGIDFTASFLVSGQIRGDAHRLFEVYSAGNFVEASPRAQFLQIGETKYGKPILDRALTPESTLDHAAKVALLSFDASIRSNLSVGLPIDVLRYHTGGFQAQVETLEAGNPYWRALREGYSQGLQTLVDTLPAPPATLG
jgi:putative proteasome-type protease